MAELWSWRLAFAINLALGPVVFYGVRTLVAEAPARTGVRRPDVGGLPLVSVGIVTLTFGLIISMIGSLVTKFMGPKAPPAPKAQTRAKCGHCGRTVIGTAPCVCGKG